MRKYLNGTSLPISMQVFLATDHYDHEDDTISATALLKPTRQIILAGRIPPTDRIVELQDLVSSRLGTAIHDGIEKAWMTNYVQAFKDLGYPDSLISRIRINPSPEEATQPNIVPIFLEQRKYREIDGQKVSGKFDFISEGVVEDFKSTSAFTYINNTKSEDYILQGSIYRWLAPDLITTERLRISFIFRDWSAVRARTEKGYPPNQIHSVEFTLLPVRETEMFIRNKIRDVRAHENTPEEELPRCSDKELWRKPPQWKYYKDPNKRTRSTKNFDNAIDAHTRLAKDGNKGIVIEKPGEVVACKYCPAFAICTQKDELIADGSLQL